MMISLDNFNYDFWSFIEQLLTPEQINNPDINEFAQEISKYIEIIGLSLDKQLTEIISDYDPEKYEFVTWSFSGICVKKKDNYE